MNKMDYLKGINYDFEQDDRFLKAGTDTYLLGSFLDNIKNKSVLDIGTNTGALLLYAHSKGASKLSGIDINKDALLLAEKNLKRYTNNFNLYHCRIQDFHEDSFDVIICNPPFFEEDQTMRAKESLNSAMYDFALPIEDLFTSINKLLKENGTCYLIYQAQRIPEIFNNLEKNKLKIMKMQFVFTKNNDIATRVLIKIKKGKSTKINVIKPIII